MDRDLALRRFAAVYARWSGCFPPFRTPPRFVILRPGARARLRRGEVPLRLAPSMVYGTGTNPITASVLERLPELVGELDAARARVLDLGTGSGVLAIACARLGVRHVEGLDCDAGAVKMARENARSNGVRVRFATDLPVSEPYDLIIANLPGEVHFGYLRAYRQLLAPGGRALLSGFDEEQRPRLRRACREAGLRVGGVRVNECGWESWLVSVA